MANNDHEDVKSRISTLEGRWKQTDGRIEHLDGRVGTIAVEMSAIKADLGALIKGVDGLLSRTSQPTNWIGVASLVVTMVVVGAQYVDLRLVPVALDITENHSTLKAMQAESIQLSSLIGEYKAKVDAAADDILHLDAMHHDTQERVIELEKEAAAAIVSRRAIGDYIRQVDELGSRRWLKGDLNKASRVGSE